jgi:hypothetical protein
VKCKHSVLWAVVFCISLLWTSTLLAAVKVTILGGATATQEWTDKLRERIDDPELEFATALPEKLPEGTSSELARHVGSDLLVILDPPSATTKIPGFSIWDKSGNLLWEGAVVDAPTADLATAIRFAKVKLVGIGKGTVRITLRVGPGSGELGVAGPLRLGLEKILVQNPKIAITESIAKEPAATDFVLLVSENDVTAADLLVQCQLLDREKKTLLEVKYLAPRFNGKFFANLANELATALKKEPFATEAVVAQASRRLQQTGDRFHARKETSPAILHWLSGALLNIDDFDLTGNLIRQLAEYGGSIRNGQPDELQRLTVGLMQYRLQAIRQLPAKKEALLEFEVGKKPGNRRFYTLGYLNSAVQNAVRSRQIELGEPWPEDVTKLISKLHAEASAELFARWQAVVEDDPKSFAEFTTHLNESQRMMVHYANGQSYRVQEVDAVVVDMVLAWQKMFDRLPKEEQHWNLITQGLQHVTLHTPAAVGERFEPVWQKLEKHEHPLIKLLALRGRIQHDWDSKIMSSEERVRRYKTMMDAVVVAAKEEKTANRPGNLHTLKEVISAFNNNVRYPEVAEVSKVQLEYAATLLKEGLIHDVALTQMTNPIDESTAKTSLELLRSRPNPSDSLVRRIQDLERQFPALRDPETIAAMPKVRQILDMAGFGPGGARDILRFVHIQGESASGIWVKNPLGNPSVVVLTINLKSGATTTSDWVAIPRTGGFYSLLNEQLTVGFASETDFFFGGKEIGIYQCALAEGSVPQPILSAEELASKPTALQLVDKHLYVGTADGRLWQYQLESRKKELLISGKRDFGKSKLDGVGAFEIAAILHDKPRSRILLLAHSKLPELKTLTNGVWSLPLDKAADPKSLEKLIEIMTPSGNSAYAVSGGLSNDDLLVTSWGLLHWNLKSDQKVLISNANWGPLKPTNNEFLPLVRSPVLCQESLWWPGRGGLSEKKPGPSRTLTHNLDLGDKRFHDSSDTPYLAPIDQNRFLMYSGQRLYEITPHK